MYHFTKYNPNIVDGTGKSLEDLKGIIDQGQPVLIYHTNLGSKPLLRVFRFDNKPAKQVSNIHVTLLIGTMITITIISIHFGVIFVVV